MSEEVAQEKFDPVEALILDLLEWIGPDTRPYSEVIEAWRTSCPRLPVWEEANSRGFIQQEHRSGVGVFISVTSRGRAFLAERANHEDTKAQTEHKVK